MLLVDVRDQGSTLLPGMAGACGALTHCAGQGSSITQRVLLCQWQHISA